MKAAFRTVWTNFGLKPLKNAANPSSFNILDAIVYIELFPKWPAYALDFNNKYG